MRRLLALSVAAVAAVAAAGPAWAHEEINPATVTTGKPVFLTLSTANEKKSDMTKVVLTAPSAGLVGDSTRDPAGWTPAHTNTTVTWTGGPLKPGRFENFGFEVESFSQPGTITFKVGMTFADGSTESVDVAVVATAPDGSAPPAAAAGGGGTEAHDEGDEAGEGGGSGRANLAVGLSIVALLGAGGALLLGRRKTPAAPSGPAGATPPAGGSGDW